jgi:hypothetical protein
MREPAKHDVFDFVGRIKPTPLWARLIRWQDLDDVAY